MDAVVAGAVAAELGSEVVASAALSGGDVAAAYRLTLDDGRTVFAKTLHDAPPDAFVTEAAGLSWLRNAGVLAVPEVLAVGERPAFLVLEWIDEGPGHATTEHDLGVGLAALHRAGAPTFGREDRRSTGSRGLPNDPAPTWAEFLAERRLRPLAALAATSGALDDGTVGRLRRVADRMADLVGPEEPPARLHGDLWAGNRLVDRAGRNWLIDPAAFGGHREHDLAMMRLFGGFGPDAYAAYQDAHPLAPGWQDRVALHQIAPLVVHAVKFGGGYRRAASEAVARYC